MTTATNTKTASTSTRKAGLTPLSKGLITVGLLATGVFATKHFAPGLFGGEHASTPSSVPPKAELPTSGSTMEAVGAPLVTANVPIAKPGCTDQSEVRMLIWAWNSQQGLLHATGGPQAAEGSNMCKHHVNLNLARQDDATQMQAELVKCASELGKGASDCKQGAHYVAIMGDGSAAFLAAVQPQLTKLCPDCNAEIIGSAGYSRGEDKFMGPSKWKASPPSAAGGVIAGYLRDGDWNIAMKWAGDNNICNNPDETTYDPKCLNWVAASDYIDAGQKYIAGYCETRPVVEDGKRTGDTQKVCVDGVVTWTPGDVNVAQGKGGLVSIASTREYIYQMPNVIIGLHKWNRAHRPTVTGLLAAMTESGELVKHDASARLRAAEISSVVYKEKDSAYWAKYFDVVTERDAKGLAVELGGSSVNNLADNLHLFGLADHSGVSKSIFAATYGVFGNIVVHYYPTLVPSYPAVDTVVDTSYLAEVAKQASSTTAAYVPTYAAADPQREHDEDKQVLARKSWKINFQTGSAKLAADSTKLVDELYAQTVVTQTIIEINGHTDSDGDPRTNRELSRMRALTVRDELIKRSPVNFPETRFRVTGFGEDQPVATNDTAANKAKNRRVEIVMRTK